jgi:formate dehydrogenase major subunit
MSRRAAALDALEPDPVASVHPLDLAAIGGKPGDLGDDRVAARQGHALRACRRRLAAWRGVRAVLLLRGGDQPAHECGARSLRQDPEFKYCAIRVSLGGPAPEQSSFGGGQARARQRLELPAGELAAAP